MKRLLLILCALCAPAGTARAGGANTFEFLSLDADARPAGLGGAYTAAATDANAMLYNPPGSACSPAAMPS